MTKTAKTRRQRIDYLRGRENSWRTRQYNKTYTLRHNRDVNKGEWLDIALVLTMLFALALYIGISG